MSANLFSRLDPFDCQKGDFDYYLEQFDHFLDLNSVQDEGKKVPLFISSIGQDTYKILKEMCAPADPKEKSFDQMKSLLLEYFARREFYRRNQRPGEYTGAFINELKRLSLKCNFGPFAHDALRDRIACGKLPEEKASTTPTAAAPTTSKGQPQPKPTVPQEVQAIAEKKTKAKKAAAESSFVVVNPAEVQQKQPKGPKPQKGGATGAGQPKQHKCKICGHDHKETDCAHKDATCFMCRKKGHIASVCREKANKAQQQPVQVHVHVQQNTGVKN